MIHHDPSQDGGPVLCTTCGTPYVLDVDKGFAFATLNDDHGLFITVTATHATITALANNPFIQDRRIGRPDPILGLNVVGETVVEWGQLFGALQQAEAEMN